MPIQLQGFNGIAADVSGTGFRAVHTHIKPAEHGALGHYAVAATTGTIAAGVSANAQIFHARWTDSARFCVIHEIRLNMFRNITTAFAVGLAEFNAVVIRGWSADGSGGTALTITGNNMKMRTNMGSSLFGAIRIASTGALTAGTSTLDSHDIGKLFCLCTATANAMFVPSGNSETSGGGLGPHIYNIDSMVEHPIVLAQNEGIAVRATVPATGTWAASISMKWSEVSAF